jgi:hypothetical protein
MTVGDEQRTRDSAAAQYSTTIQRVYAQRTQFGVQFDEAIAQPFQNTFIAICGDE